MAKTNMVVRYVAWGLMAAFTGLAALFVAGYAFEDPGGLEALGLVSAWLVPLGALTLLAYLWPSGSRWVLLAGVALLAGMDIYAALDTEALRRTLEDSGPVLGIGSMALGLPLATLGLRRPGWGGALLVATSALALVGFLVGVAGEGAVGIGAALSTSSTIICVPFLLVGALLLIAAATGRGSPPPDLADSPPKPPVGTSV